MPPTSSAEIDHSPSIQIPEKEEKKKVYTTMAELGIRPAPPRPVQRSMANVAYEDAIIYTNLMMPIKIVGKEDEAVRETLIDLKFTERRSKYRLHHHEIVAVECYSGEVFKTVLSEQTFDSSVEQWEKKQPVNWQAYTRAIHQVIKNNTMNAVQADKRSVVLDLYTPISGIMPLIPLEKLEGKPLTDYIQAELEKEENEFTALRDANRQRWNEFTKELTEACRKINNHNKELFNNPNESYITLLRRKLTRPNEDIGY